MRYAADIADAGKFKGEWVVVDMTTGELACDCSFPTGSQAHAYAAYLNGK